MNVHEQLSVLQYTLLCRASLSVKAFTCYLPHAPVYVDKASVCGIRAEISELTTCQPPLRSGCRQAVIKCTDRQDVYILGVCRAFWPARALIRAISTKKSLIGKIESPRAHRRAHHPTPPFACRRTFTDEPVCTTDEHSYSTSAPRHRTPTGQASRIIIEIEDSTVSQHASRTCSLHSTASSANSVLSPSLLAYPQPVVRVFKSSHAVLQHMCGEARTMTYP